MWQKKRERGKIKKSGKMSENRKKKTKMNKKKKPLWQKIKRKRKKD